MSAERLWGKKGKGDAQRIGCQWGGGVMEQEEQREEGFSAERGDGVSTIRVRSRKEGREEWERTVNTCLEAFLKHSSASRCKS